jgi:hypothetical protein
VRSSPRLAFAKKTIGDAFGHVCIRLTFLPKHDNCLGKKQIQSPGDLQGSGFCMPCCTFTPPTGFLIVEQSRLFFKRQDAIHEMKRGNTMIKPADLPAGYPEFILSLKNRIRSAQVKAAVSVNRELILLYWQIGSDILARQEREGWGTKVIGRLSSDLINEFPDMKGFSVVEPEIYEEICRSLA